MSAAWDWLALHGLGVFYFLFAQVGIFLSGAVFGQSLIRKAFAAINTLGVPKTTEPAAAKP